MITEEEEESNAYADEESVNESHQSCTTNYPKANTETEMEKI